MRLIYEGTDITGYVETESCRVLDRMGGADDLIDLTLWNPEAWSRWAPKADDRISVSEGSYDSGTMYVRCVVPEDGKFRLIAGGLPGAARTRRSRLYRGLSLAEIARLCAAECGVKSALYGLNGAGIYPYIERTEEGAGAFLARLAAREGAFLKCVNGALNLIGARWAAARPAAEGLTVNAGQAGVTHRTFPAEALKRLTVVSAWAEASAEDGARTYGRVETRAMGEALTAALAGRWARGTLTWENLTRETLVIDGAFMEKMTAAARVDVSGGTAADGRWMVYEAEHELTGKTTRVTLARVPEVLA